MKKVVLLIIMDDYLREGYGARRDCLPYAVCVREHDPSLHSVYAIDEERKKEMHF